MDELPAIDSLRALLEKQLRAIESAEPGIREGADPEHLHRFRVATRRTRALIRAARPLIRDQLASIDRELRWLGGASGPMRDLDVLIDHLNEVIDELDSDRAGGDAIVASLERERLQQRDVLLKAIDSDRYRELVARLAEAIPALTSSGDDVGLDHLAAKELGRLTEAYDALGPEPSDDELHAVRIKAKHARYAAELAASTEGRPLTALADSIRDLQDVIGVHQDAVVAEQRVRALARDDDRVAAGRIVELERRRRLDAREQLPVVWRRVERSAEKAFG